MTARARGPRGAWILAKPASKSASKKPTPKRRDKTASAPKKDSKALPSKSPASKAPPTKPAPPKQPVAKSEPSKPVGAKPAPGLKTGSAPVGKPIPKKNEITLKTPGPPRPEPRKPVLLSALPKAPGAPSTKPKPAPPAAPGDPKTRFKTAFSNDFGDGKAAAAKLFAAAGLGNLKHQKLPSLEDEMAAKPLTKSPLSKAQLKEFREILVLKRAELVGDVQSMESEALTGGSGSLSNLPQHMAEQGTDTFDQSMALNIAASKRQTLRDIDAALKRIDENTFGICEMLGKPVELARLQAEPWTRFSIEGARHKERQSMLR